MHERWVNLCRRLGARTDPAPVASRIEALYSTPPRAYHNLSHIEACFKILDEFRDEADDPNLVEFALWFHDCIYDPLAKDNEARSADEAVHALRELGVESEDAPAHIRRLIMATRHGAADLAIDEALIADIDLSILGTDPAIYRQYAHAIRAEYAFVPENAFRAGRAAVLQGFLNREILFFKPAFRDRYEAAARRNLADEIRDLMG